LCPHSDKRTKDLMILQYNKANPWHSWALQSKSVGSLRAGGRSCAWSLLSQIVKNYMTSLIRRTCSQSINLVSNSPDSLMQILARNCTSSKTITSATRAFDNGLVVVVVVVVVGLRRMNYTTSR
jgi:hypothetical protein